MNYFDLMNVSCLDVGFDFDDEKYNMFMSYMSLLLEWNKNVNLTSITDEEQIIKKHFIDSIKIFKFSPLREMKSVIDVGTGAGFPGIPMSIVNPNMKVVLLDSLNKRINFLEEVKNKLGLKNIETIHGRAEDYAVRGKLRDKFDAAVSRAVASLPVLSEYCLPYVKVGGYFIALKGPAVEEEILLSKNAISSLGGTLEDIIKVSIEESDLEHNIVIIKKIKDTPKQFPRKAGTASKKPIL